MAVLFTISTFLLVIATVTTAVPQLFGTGQQICNYQYAIPNGGNCVTYGPALEQKLDAVQQDMDRTKLQYVSENTIMREELRKLSQQVSVADVSLQDMTKELKTLQSAVTALQARQGSSNTNTGASGTTAAVAMLEQLVKATQAQLTQNMLMLENQMRQAQSRNQNQRSQDAIQQSKVDTAFQAQLRQQQTDMTSVMQQVQQLDLRVNSLERVTHNPNPFTNAPPVSTVAPATTTTHATTTTTRKTTTAAGSTATGGTVNNAQVQQMHQDLQLLDTRLSKLESDYQVDVAYLKHNVTSLNGQIANHTLKLSDIAYEMDFLDHTTLPNVVANVTRNYDVLRDITTKFNRDFPPLQNQVQIIAGNVTEFAKQLGSMGLKVLTTQAKLRTDERDIVTVKNDVAALESLMNTYGLTTAVPSTTTFAVPPTPGGGLPFPTRRPTPQG